MAQGAVQRPGSALPAASHSWRGLALGCVPGEGEEDLIEAWVSQGEVAKLDAARDQGCQRLARFDRAADGDGELGIRPVALSSPAELCLQQPRGGIEMRRVDERNM